MSEEFKDRNGVEEGEASFAELFEQYSEGGGDDLSIGDKVSGTVIQVGETSVFVDTGTKLDGVVEKAELLDEDGNCTVADGDTVELYVVGKDSGGIKLSRAISGIGGLAMLEEAQAGGLPVEGKVESTCKGGFNVTLLQRRAFCPVSQIDARFVETPEEYVGKTFEFLVTKLEQHGRNIVVSRRSLIERDAAESAETFISETKVGDEVEGTITRLAGFGAFVEILPGLEGLVHISQISYGRIGHPEEAVTVGQKVKAKIVRMENDDKGRLKISLSMKELAQDPWDTLSSTFAEGDMVTGKVVRLADFGAFVEIAPGIDGLVHVSEMSYTKRVNKPADFVSEGDQVTVKIKSIDPDQRRIGLSMKDAEGDPWGDVAERYQAGQKVQGTVEKLEQFGIFIQLEPGITGLLPKSVIARSEKPATYEKLHAGDTVEVVIGQVKTAERRISLTTGDVQDDGDWKEFAPKKQQSSGNSGNMGLLGTKLQAAFDKKK
ncbi:30S ribosomal protein S1 [Pseudodesulfovibrio sp. S3]|uniref:30S ribosomal protein S1 n=1 Tax=unclassified Pseudodesulfovibrio TaxID=2661612 RepID=UPI000FEB7ECC|nr:30S ribosomal protein S1 [Pseudodesulfovibrio sp. S3]MCJ2163309.1 30S ribosomal protein S1 [Pseudodesulfovibrio sp. S3-i]RWU07288.1 30S ribosomal protein S1 [Pseudodesulfovibrio sp. S3]